MLLRGLKKATNKARKLFEHRRLKQVVGVNLLSGMILLSQISIPASATQTHSPPEVLNLATVAGEMETQNGFQVPLSSYQVTQGFHLFHLGIDLASAYNTPIRPVAQGKVERVEFGRYGFGNSILINHGSNLKSFYAHLGKIKVKQDQEVGIGDDIGSVGTSGRTTGPHLHLEIWQHDRPLNPKLLLELEIKN